MGGQGSHSACGRFGKPTIFSKQRKNHWGREELYFVNVIFTSYEIHQEIDVASDISFPATFLYLLFTRKSTLCGTSCRARSQEYTCQDLAPGIVKYVFKGE